MFQTISLYLSVELPIPNESFTISDLHLTGADNNALIKMTPDEPV
jgi:hypothetical protein